MTGIPAGHDAPPAHAGGAPPAAAAAAGGAPGAAAAAAGAGPNAQPLNLFPQGLEAAAAAAGAGGAGNLDFLRTHPQFQALRAMVAAQPGILAPMLQELGKQNPQLLALINGNQAEFLALLNEPGPEGGFDFGGMEGMLGGEEGEEGEEGGVQVQVTPEEQAAIERLIALGFDRNMVIQTYFACDKNEEVAANLLCVAAYAHARACCLCSAHALTRYAARHTGSTSRWSEAECKPTQQGSKSTAALADKQRSQQAPPRCWLMETRLANSYKQTPCSSSVQKREPAAQSASCASASSRQFRDAALVHDVLHEQVGADHQRQHGGDLRASEGGVRRRAQGAQRAQRKAQATHDGGGAAQQHGERLHVLVGHGVSGRHGGGWTQAAAREPKSAQDLGSGGRAQRCTASPAAPADSSRGVATAAASAKALGRGAADACARTARTTLHSTAGLGQVSGERDAQRSASPAPARTQRARRQLCNAPRRQAPAAQQQHARPRPGTHRAAGRAAALRRAALATRRAGSTQAAVEASIAAIVTGWRGGGGAAAELRARAAGEPLLVATSGASLLRS
jgi:hypothetical protein